MNEPLERAGVSGEAQPLATAEFNLGRVLKTTLVLVLIGGLGFAAVEYWNNQKPTLVKVTGRVMWNGQPVTIGAVMTEHTDDPLLTAIGAFDSEGKFELSSNGEPGAAPGTHKVIVASYGMGVSPPPLVPQKYLKAKTTPLSILVTKDPSKNHFELEVMGEMPKSEEGGGPGNGPPQGGGNRENGPRGAGPDTTGGGRPPLENSPEAPLETGADPIQSVETPQPK